MNAIKHRDLLDMDASERLALIGELWDSLQDKDIPLTPAQMAELDRRLESFEADLGGATPLEDFKKSFTGR
jgi:putative addiction module component (TIGR02574 family)